MNNQQAPVHNKIRCLITGVTGMVGEGVLHECLSHPDVESIVVVNRKPCGITHPKLTEIIHQDFHHIEALASQLQGLNACYFCLGVSSVGKSEAEFTSLTYDLTLHMAEHLSAWNPEMVFCYVSGSGTDSSEKGRVMWARVKGKTENDLMKLPFLRAYMFRPGYIHPTKGLKNTHSYYKYMSWLYPVLKPLLPNHLLTLQDIGYAMIHAVTRGTPKQVLEVRDLVALARRT